MASTTSSWEVLRSLGFASDSSVISDPPGGLAVNFGDMTLKASVCTNRRFQPIILLSGVMRTPRTIVEVSCEMPREVESWEHGIAWVTWCLDKHAGGTYQPALPVAWLEPGRQYSHLLPWERERAAYAARPRCQVDREWGRVAIRKLAEVVAITEDDVPASLHFDGELLKIRCGDSLIAVPASGTPWASCYTVRMGALRRLPKRLSGTSVEFSIWNATLTIGNRVYAGVFAP